MCIISIWYDDENGSMSIIFVSVLWGFMSWASLYLNAQWHENYIIFIRKVDGKWKKYKPKN